MIVHTNAAEIEPVFPLQINKYNTPNSMTQWTIELDKLLLLFQEREAVVRGFVE